MSKNVSDVIKIQKTILQLTGIWPKEQPTLYAKISGKVSVFITTIFVATLIAEALKQIHNYILLIEHLSLIISPTSFLVKMVMFRRKHEQFVKLYGKLGRPIFNEHPDHMNTIKKKSARTSAVIGLTYMFTCFLVCFLFCARPLYTKADMPVRFSFEIGPYKAPMAAFQVLCK